jgi:hypothetical protein
MSLDRPEHPDDGETGSSVHQPRFGSRAATPRKTFDRNRIPIAVMTTVEEIPSEEREPIDPNHPDIAAITGVGTNNSGVGHAARKVMAKTSRGEGPVNEQ